MRQAYGAQGLTLPEAVILASIVERETPFDEEKPRIASVYTNRVREEMPLQADPTVQYAIGYQEENQNWWKAPLFFADLRLNHPYNTYVIEGLPPGPSPIRGSLQCRRLPSRSKLIFYSLSSTANPIRQAAMFLANPTMGTCPMWSAAANDMGRRRKQFLLIVAGLLPVLLCRLPKRRSRG